MTTIASVRERNRKAQARWRASPDNRARERARRNRAAESLALQRRRADPETWGATVINNIRNRAKKSGWDCTIVASDLRAPDVCPVLGIPIFSYSGDHDIRKHGNSPSVDRIDNRKGYTPENVRVISLRANMLKSDATIEELRAVLRYMENGQ